MKPSIILLSIVLLCCITNCSQAEPESEVATTIVETSPRKDLSFSEDQRSTIVDMLDFYTNFTNDVLSYIDSDQCDQRIENIVISPLSAYMLLSMVAEGIAKSNHDNIDTYRNYLCVKDMGDLKSINEIFLNELTSIDKSVDISLSNSIWLNKFRSISLKKDYSSLLTESYKANISQIPFDKEGLKTINEWCGESSGNLIDNYFSEINPESFAVLINSIYFKAPWENSIFDARKTHKSIFHGAKYDSNIDFMISDEFTGLYQSDENFETIIINFGNSAYYLEIILPSAHAQFKSLSQILKNVVANKESSSLSLSKLIVEIPKMQIHSKLDLNAVFNYINNKGLIADLNFEGFDLEENDDNHRFGIEYKQENLFSIDETGAKIASVSSGEIIDGAPGPSDLKLHRVKADRPFLFFVREVSSGACLLSGGVSQL